MGILVRDGGVWKETDPSIRDAGIWKPVDTGHVRDGGVWKEFYSSIQPYEISGGWETGLEGWNIYLLERRNLSWTDGYSLVLSSNRNSGDATKTENIKGVGLVNNFSFRVRAESISIGRTATYETLIWTEGPGGRILGDDTTSLGSASWTTITVPFLEHNGDINISIVVTKPTQLGAVCIDDWKIEGVLP